MFTTLHRPLVTLMTATALAAGVTACGSDDGGGGDSTRAEAPAPDFGTPRGERELSVAKAVEDAYGAFGDADADGVCERLTAAAQTQLGGGRAADCPPTVERLLERAERTGTIERLDDMEVGRVRLRGDEARATVSFGAQAARIDLRQVDGEWRLGSALALPSAP